MTREHIWPQWLVEHAKVYNEGIVWTTERNISPRNATLPLCRDCNSQLGAELEEPVSRIFPRLEAGFGISDRDAEKLVRWLWKFEGLFVAYENAGNPNWRYSDRWTLIERVLGNAIDTVRGALSLAVGLVHRNDPEFHDWPMGIDSGLSDLDGIFVSGVFGRTALMVSLTRYDGYVPSCFGVYRLSEVSANTDDPCFFPPTCFPFAADAVFVTERASGKLKACHEEYARAHRATQEIVAVRPRIIIPG